MKKVIVVEDNKLLRENICEILELEGYEVIATQNGMVAWEQIQLTIPDLILSDLNMPVMDGLELLKRVRERDDLKKIPFIFLTVRNTMQELRMGMHYGADDYLMKPFEIDHLLNAVNTGIRKVNRENTTNTRGNQNSRNHEVAINEHLQIPLQKLQGLGQDIEQHGNIRLDSDVESIGKVIQGVSAGIEQNLCKILTSMKLDSYESCPDLIPQEWKNDSVCRIDLLISDLLKHHFLASANRVTVRVASADLNIPVDMAEAILKELIENALRFSDVHHQVDVFGSQVSDSEYLLKIVNYGTPFPLNRLNQIGPYNTFHNPEEHNSGVGLGLSNAQRMLALIDRSLRVKTNKPKETVVSIEIGIAHSESTNGG